MRPLFCTGAPLLRFCVPCPACSTPPTISSHGQRCRRSGRQRREVSYSEPTMTEVLARAPAAVVRGLP